MRQAPIGSCYASTFDPQKNGTMENKDLVHSFHFRKNLHIERNLWRKNIHFLLNVAFIRNSCENTAFHIGLKMQILYKLRVMLVSI